MSQQMGWDTRIGGRLRLRDLHILLAVAQHGTMAKAAAQLGVSQPAVSKHLGVLKQAGLVEDRRQGRETHYSARPQGLKPLINWMNHYGVFWRERFDRLENLLNRMDQ